MAVVAGKPFVESVEGDSIRLFLGGVHIQDRDGHVLRVKAADRRNVRDVQGPDVYALVEVGDDEAIALFFEVMEPLKQVRLYSGRRGRLLRA